MKSLGITRRIDPLGRIVIPIELRSTLNINVKDALEIFTEGDTILLRKYEPLCLFCGSSDSLKEFKGKKVCVHCRDDAKKL